MSEKKAFIVFEFDTDSAVKNIKTAQTELTKLKEENKNLTKEQSELLKVQKELEEQGKKDSKQYKENADKLGQISEKLVLNQSDVRNLNKEVRENNKVLDQNSKFLQANEGSIEQLRLSLSDATARWNAMSQAERETTDTGKNLQKHIKSLSDNLKQLEGSVGDNRRNVGNYKSALEGLPGPIGGAVKGVKGFNDTLMKNPILGVITLLMGLLQIIMKNEKVIKAVDAVTASFNAVLGVLTDRVLQAWEAIKSLDFGGLIDAFNGAGDAMANAASQAMALTKAQQMLKDATRESNELAAKNEVQIQRLLQQSKDRTKSDEERIEALKKAQKLEQEAFDAQFKNAQREYLVLEKLASLSTSTEAEKQKVSEAKIKYLNLEAESVKRQEKIAREMNTLENEIAGDQQKRLEKKQKAIEDAAKKADELRRKEAALFAELIDARIRNMVDGEEKEIAIEQERLRRRLATITGDSAAELELIEQLKFESSKKIEAIEQKGEEERKKAKEAREQLAKEEDFRRFQNDIAELQLKGELTLEKELEMEMARFELLKSQKEYTQEELRKLELDHEKAITEIHRKENEERLALEHRIADARLQLTHSTMDALSAIAELFAEEGEQMAEFAKGLAVFQIAVDTAMAISTTIANAQKAASAGGPAAPALAVAYTAAGIATVLTNVARAKKILEGGKKPKYEFGGNVEGASHSEGGVPIEAEGNEVVINKHSARKWWKTLDFINRDGGGVAIKRPKFALGGNVGATDGGFTSRAISDPVNQSQQMTKMMAETVKDAVSSVNIVTRISDLKRAERADNFVRASTELR
jgi:hypothetical protein